MRFGKFTLVMSFAAFVSGCQTIKDVTDSVTGPDDAGNAASSGSAPPAPAAPLASTALPATAGGFGLKGMSADGLRAAWGDPVLKRDESGSELWQYSGPGCSLLVYLYPAPGGAKSVSHAEAVPGGVNDEAIAACAKAAGKPPLKPIS
jgi:hypothetical protein